MITLGNLTLTFHSQSPFSASAVGTKPKSASPSFATKPKSASPSVSTPVATKAKPSSGKVNAFDDDDEDYPSPNWVSISAAGSSGKSAGDEAYLEL